MKLCAHTRIQQHLASIYAKNWKQFRLNYVLLKPKINKQINIACMQYSAAAAAAAALSFHLCSLFVEFPLKYYHKSTSRNPPHSRNAFVIRFHFEINMHVCKVVKFNSLLMHFDKTHKPQNDCKVSDRIAMYSSLFWVLDVYTLVQII